MTKHLQSLMTNVAMAAALRLVLPYTLADSGERFRYYTMSSVFPFRDCPSFHCFRVLPPLIAGLLPLNRIDAFVVAGFVFQVLAGTILWHIAEQLHGSKRIAALATAWFWVTWGSVQSFNDPLLITDPVQAFWSLASLYLLLNRRYALALPMLVSGAAVKELVLLVPMIYAVYAVIADEDARRRPVWLAALVAAPLVAWLLLRTTLGSRFGYVIHEDEGYLRAPWLFTMWLPSLSTFPKNLVIAALYFFSACGGAWVLGALGFFRSNRRQRALTLASLPPMLFLPLYQLPERALATFPWATLIPAACYLSKVPMPLAVALLLANAAFTIRMNASVAWLPRVPVLLPVLGALIVAAVWAGWTRDSEDLRSDDRDRIITPSPARDWIPAGVSLLLVLLLAAVAVMQIERRALAATSRWTEWAPGSFTGTRVMDDDGGIPALALAPDGQSVAFVGASQSDDAAVRTLWRRRLDGSAPEPLAGTEGASAPFWSPDGRAIGFFAAGMLKTIDLTTRSVKVLAEAPMPRAATWSEHDVILFAPDVRGGLVRVAGTGGPVTPVTVPDTARGEESHRWPSFLTDGDRFVFIVQCGEPRASGTYVASLSGHRPVRISTNRERVVHTDGFLVIGGGGRLRAQAFDERRATVVGEQRDLGPLASTMNGDAGAFAVSSETLAFVPASPRTNRRAEIRTKWIDRTGRDVPPHEAPRRSDRVRADLPRRAVPTSWSPDGRVLLFHAPAPPVWSVFAFTPASQTSNLLISDKGADDVQAQFSPDGHWIAYTSRTNGEDVYVQRYPPTGEKWRVSIDGGSQPRWRSDGRELVYVSADRFFRSVSIEAQPSFRVGPPRPLFEAPLRSEDPATFSYEYDMTPDGQSFAVNAIVSRQEEASVTLVSHWRALAQFR